MLKIGDKLYKPIGTDKGNGITEWRIKEYEIESLTIPNGHKGYWFVGGGRCSYKGVGDWDKNYQTTKEESIEAFNKRIASKFDYLVI